MEEIHSPPPDDGIELDSSASEAVMNAYARETTILGCQCDVSYVRWTYNS